MVLVKVPKENKLSTPFNTTSYTVTQKHGTQITAEGEGRMITRKSCHFKKVLKNSEEREEKLEEIEIPNMLTPCQQKPEPKSKARRFPIVNYLPSTIGLRVP